MENWGAEGTIDPFKDIYDLVFQMTVRMASCQELATDPAMVQKMGELYWKLEQNATLVSLLLPWFPSTARKTTMQASKGLSDMVSHYVEVRRKANVPNLDAIDVLITDGADTPTIVHVCVPVLLSMFVRLRSFYSLS
jgi:sterol 14-demethylase